MLKKFDKIYFSLDGKARPISLFSNDDAVELLKEVCNSLEHAPPIITLAGLYVVVAEDHEGLHSLTYAFRYHNGSVGDPVFIFLIPLLNDIRFFIVETSFPFALCEYRYGSHLNYGQVELKNVPTRILEVLREE